MPFNIVGGVTQRYYYTLPNSLDLITTSPTRDDIYKFLSQIPYKKFPEFVLDILTMVEGHSPVDVTDGPGDQKQDILTITPQGERCLTQCKHTEKLGSTYAGDEADRMVAACLRKDCKVAFFVTNGDLTPPTKTFFTDNEYNRGLPAASGVIFSMDYWNGAKIWEKIKNCSDILNKWFSGMGQTSALKSFQFDVTIQKLPYKNQFVNGSSYDEIIALLLGKSIITRIGDTDDYSAQLTSGIIVEISPWYQFSGQLDINYMLPDDLLAFLHQPMYALRIKATVAGEKFDPEAVRDEIIASLFSFSLPKLEDSQWWHITAGKCHSFVFIHDIGQPRELKLCSAKTYIQVGTLSVKSELEYCSLKEADFKPVKDEDGDEVDLWEHSSGIKVYQMFDQKLDPVEVYKYQYEQLGRLNGLKASDFYAAEGIEPSLSMRIRKILPASWIALTQDSGNVLLWGVTDDSDINFVHKKLEVIGVKVLRVKDEDRDHLLASVANNLPPTISAFISEMQILSFPVSLQKRILACIIELPIPVPMDEHIAMRLLNYKFAIEDYFGFSNMGEQTEIKSHTSELPSLLYDLFTVRGKLMLDIGIRSNPLKIFIRFKDYHLVPSNDYALICIDEVQKILSDIHRVVTGESINSVGYFVRS